MVTAEVASPVRISKIAGRYLIFDAEAAATLRRQENINGTLVGTAPQQPTQNIFLGLPIEIRPEEADTLVYKKAAYIVDDVAAHQSVLRSPDHEARKTYIESLQGRKRAADRTFAAKNAKRAIDVAQRMASSQTSCSPNQRPDDVERHSSLVQPAEVVSSCPTDTQVSLLAVTPASSANLLPRANYCSSRLDTAPTGPLCRFLQGAGYYMTPGLRFGAQYSIYPGDPLRFHAHFMANQYDWCQEIPILDIVGGGRLATAVKKAFLIGGEQPATEATDNLTVRTFSVEWAGM